MPLGPSEISAQAAWGVDLYCFCMKEGDAEPYELWYDGEYEVLSAGRFAECCAAHDKLHAAGK